MRPRPRLMLSWGLIKVKGEAEKELSRKLTNDQRVNGGDGGGNVFAGDDEADAALR